MIADVLSTCDRELEVAGEPIGRIEEAEARADAKTADWSGEGQSGKQKPESKKMKRDFDQLMDDVKQLHEKLMAATPVTRGNLGQCAFAGVYLFTEKGEHLYVGRTRGLKSRLVQHVRANPAGASFALTWRGS